MAVFLSVADESKDTDTFFYGGWGGPMERSGTGRSRTPGRNASWTDRLRSPTYT